MRVLQVVHGWPPKARGGTELYTYQLSMELSKRNDVHVVYPVVHTTIYPLLFLQRKPSLRSFDQGPLKIHEICMAKSSFDRFSFRPEYNNRYVDVCFEGLLDRLEPDVVHINHLIDLSSSILRVAKDKGYPVVLTLHDYWFLCPLINMLKADSSICTGPDEDGSNCAECWREQRKKLIDYYVDNRHLPRRAAELFISPVLYRIDAADFSERRKHMGELLMCADKLIAPSQFVKGLFVKHGISGGLIVCSSNGYDLRCFDGFKKATGPGLTFGFVGGVKKLKGLDLLVEAFTQISDPEVRLLIYGKVDQLFSSHLASKAKDPRIHIMGPFDDVRAPYSEIDVLVVPSIWQETGGPLVVKEALATGTPVIASRLGCIPEFVKDGENGLLFEAGDTGDLIKKMKIIIENPEMVRMMSRRAGRVKSIEEQASEIEQIYKEAMGLSRIPADQHSAA